jgi:hypothetical protein
MWRAKYLTWGIRGWGCTRPPRLSESGSNTNSFDDLCYGPSERRLSEFASGLGTRGYTA